MFAEIAVLDGDQQTVAKGVGQPENELPAGITRCACALARRSIEKLVSLDDNREVRYAAAEIPSPIRWSGTSRRNAAHTAAAIDASRNVRDTFGAGASVLVLVRERPRTDTVPHSNPATGLSL